MSMTLITTKNMCCGLSVVFKITTRRSTIDVRKKSDLSRKNRTTGSRGLVHPDMSGKYGTGPNLVNSAYFFFQITNHNQHAFSIKYLANLIKKYWTYFRYQKLTNSLGVFPTQRLRAGWASAILWNRCTRTYRWEATAAPVATTNHDENFWVFLYIYV